jgi:hypothetical protein
VAVSCASASPANNNSVADNHPTRLIAPTRRNARMFI